MSSPVLSETSEKVQKPEKAVKSSKESNDPSSPGGKGRLQGWRLRATQFCLAFCLILSVMDSTVVATALVVIGQHFDNFVLIQWVVLAYLLTYLGFALILTRVSDIIGRKWTTIICLIILTLASLACGLAQSLNQLIAFRAIQGLGGSGLYSMPFVALPEITPLDKFGGMSAIIGITLATAAVLGPTVGGVICTHSTWRWVFLFNVPCGVFLVVLIFIVWPKTESAGKIKWRQLDLIGCLLYLAASVLVVFALQSAGAGIYAWDSATTVACLVAAGISAILFAIWIWFLSRKERSILPLFPARIVNHKEMLANLIVTIFIGWVFYSLLIQLPERFQIVNGKSSQTAGLNILPLSATSSLGAATGGFLSSKRNNTFYTMFVGNAFILLGCGLLYSVGYDHAVQPAIFGFEVLIGFGLGLIFATATVLIRVQASEADGAAAQGLLSQSRILGGNIGLAIGTVVLNEHISSGLSDTLSPQQVKTLQQSLNVLKTFTPQEVQAVSVVFAEAFKSELLINACMAAAALVVGLFIWQRNPPSLNSKIAAETEAKARQLEERAVASPEAGV